MKKNILIFTLFFSNLNILMAAKLPEDPFQKANQNLANHLHTSSNYFIYIFILFILIVVIWLIQRKNNLKLKSIHIFTLYKL